MLQHGTPQLHRNPDKTKKPTSSRKT